ncbi:MAG: hypothetical protein ABID38_05820 [Candidatus Diapherotrites archaeon]
MDKSKPEKISLMTFVTLSSIIVAILATYFELFNTPVEIIEVSFILVFLLFGTIMAKKYKVELIEVLKGSLIVGTVWLFTGTAVSLVIVGGSLPEDIGIIWVGGIIFSILFSRIGAQSVSEFAFVKPSASPSPSSKSKNSPGTLYETDSRQLLFRLVLSKPGKKDETFEDTVKILLDQLKETGLSKDTEMKEGLHESDNFTLFELFFRSDMPEEVKMQYDLFKKNFQLMLLKNKKYKGYDLSNTAYYTLNESEKTIPIKLDEIIFKINLGIGGTGMTVHHENMPKEIKFEKFIETVNKDMGTKYYVNLYLRYYASELNESFYTLIKDVNKYLASKKLIIESFDMQDVKKRYKDAQQECVDNFSSDLGEKFKQKGIDDGSEKEIAKEVVEKGFTKINIFNRDIEGIELKKFEKIQEELFKNIPSEEFGFEYDIVITTFTVAISRYGCYTLFKPPKIE